MITTAIKSLFFFAVSFVILSVPINNQPLFDHMYGIFEPVTNDVIEATQETASKAFDKSKSFGKQLFSNANPSKVNSDKVSKKSSSRRKRRANRNIHREVYSESEIKQLKKILEED